MSLFELYKGDSMDTDRQEKLFKFHQWLTEEILGECWHEWEQHEFSCICKKCRETELWYYYHKEQRTFSSWQDYGDVVTALQLSSKYNFEEILSWMMNKQFHYLSEMLVVSSFFIVLQEWWEKEGKK